MSFCLHFTGSYTDTYRFKLLSLLYVNIFLHASTFFHKSQQILCIVGGFVLVHSMSQALSLFNAVRLCLKRRHLVVCRSWPPLDVLPFVLALCSCRSSLQHGPLEWTFYFSTHTDSFWTVWWITHMLIHTIIICKQ